MRQNIGEEVARLPYTYRYFRELSPSYLGLALLNQGVVFDVARPLRYLELGFGHGVSLNVHAAACEGEFWGNDFNPAHVEHAQSLADASGASVQLTPETFGDLAARDDLPQFDVIVLHGIWTWVTAEDHATIVDLADRALAPGGILYVSYNCVTGWAAALGLRELLGLYAAREAPHAAATTSKVDQALGFAQELVGAGAAYFKNHPHVVTQLEGMLGKDRAYVAHELFGSDWRLSSHAQIAAQFASAGLSFGAPALLLMHDCDARFGPAAVDLLSKLNDPIMREMVRDAFASAQFREDIFIKGEPKVLSPDERLKILAGWRFMLTAPFGSLPSVIKGFGVDIELETEQNIKILRALRANHYAPKTLAEIAAASGAELGDVLKNLVTLAGAGFVHPLARHRDPAAGARCSALNDFLCARALRDGNVAALASPALGAGVQVNRLQQLFLLARAKGLLTPLDQAEFIWRSMSGGDGGAWAQGRSQTDVVSELTKAAQEFESGLLPILRAAEIT